MTVVVPARNEESAIGSCLRSIAEQTYEALEILVVDGGSEDGTRRVVAEHARRDPRIRLLDNPRTRIPHALNIALGEATGSILVRVDAHAEIPPDYVETAVGLMRSGDWGGVGGRKDAVGRTPAGHAIAAALGSPFGVGDSSYHYATEPQVTDHVPYGVYRTDLARRIGGWDERLTVNEDLEFDTRLRATGHDLLLHPDLRIAWECRQSIRALFRQYRRYGRGKAQAVLLAPATLRVRHLAAPGLVAALATALAAAPRDRRATAALAVPYLAALAVVTVVNAQRVPAGSRRYVAPAFVAMHVGWGLGFWEGLAGLEPAASS